MNKFLIKYHPWKILKEALNPSFPDARQLTDMKKVMDGIDTKPSKYAREGMELVNVRNLYELIVWGLRTGVIKDEPVKNIADEFPPIKGTYESYPSWLVLLHNTTSGMSDEQTQVHGISKDTINNTRKKIQDKFSLGNSMAKFIRFAFAATNPINGPGSTRGFKPHVSWAQKAGVGSKFPIMKSKFRPADIDPTIPVYDKLKKINMPDHEDIPKIYVKKSKSIPIDDKEKVKHFNTRTTKIQTALWLLGIDRDIITPTNLRGTASFWEKPPEHLWHLLDLAKRRYTHEMAHAHPDRGGSSLRASQLTAAWNLTKKLFARRGFVLHK